MSALRNEILFAWLLGELENLWHTSKSHAEAASGQKQITQASEHAQEHTCSMHCEELFAAVHPCITCWQAAVLVAKHTLPQSTAARRAAGMKGVLMTAAVRLRAGMVLRRAAATRRGGMTVLGS